MNIIIVFILVLAAAVILWWALSRKKDPKKPVTYVCSQCGDHHCDCYREGETKSSDAD